MPQFVRPTTRVAASFIAAMAEFRAEGRGGRHDHSMIGNEIREYSPRWLSPDGFRQFVEALRAQALPETPRPDGMVPCTTLWWVEGDEYLGRLAIRHWLTPALRQVGGHIGYDVRPSARRRGHATAMLRAALPIARGLGIDQALITCDTDNIGSWKVIERNGGVLEDERDGIRRYWVATPELVSPEAAALVG